MHHCNKQLQLTVQRTNLLPLFSNNATCSLNLQHFQQTDFSLTLTLQNAVLLFDSWILRAVDSEGLPLKVQLRRQDVAFQFKEDDVLHLSNINELEELQEERIVFIQKKDFWVERTVPIN